ncbi:MAG: thioredoxin [Lachnospiraceae bacterium]|nr:thioredoxin [Lachnospiraceae bacterium]
MLELTKDTFKPEVLEAEGTILVDFYGDGCVPCQALMPHVHAMEDVYGDKIKFTALNTTKARRLAIKQGIMGLPVLAIYEGGKQIASCVKDDATQENIENMIKANI